MRRLLALLSAAAAALLLALPASAHHMIGGGQSFTFLQPGFTQDLAGTHSGFFGGVAFDPVGNPWVDFCLFSGSDLVKFNLFVPDPTTPTGEGHVATEVPSNAGCGLTNSPNGFVYSNTDVGAVQIDATTGVPTGSVVGPPGNVLGITSDPQTGNLVYVGADCRYSGTCTIYSVNPTTGTTTTFASLSGHDFIDGIAFSPDGNYLFMSHRAPGFDLEILDRSGSIVQLVGMSSEPDGISFHASPPQFVVTNNTDGTMTRFDFPGNDFTMPPVQSVFASGGFRGDLSQVGSDGCIYLSQDGTRFNNGSTTSNSSLVRICGGFAPPIPQHADLGITKTASPDPASVGDTITYTLTVTNHGPDTSSGGTVADVLPANVSYVSDDDGCTNVALTVTCPTGSLANGASQVIHIVVTATANGPAANTACVKGNDIDDNAANNCATVTTQVKPKTADLSIVKTGPAFAQSGGSITYSIAVHNGGPADATNVTVSDTLPAGETLVSATPSQGSCGPPPVTCNLGSIPNGGSATITIVANVTASCGSTLTNTATVKGDQPDTDTSNNSSSTSAFVFCVVAGGGNFVIGDRNAAIGTPVTFWGAQWWKLNSLSGGPAPASFKGFEDTPAAVTCGTSWSADPGNSTPPPSGPLPPYMAVIVSSSIGKSGATISGNTVHIVIVKTNPGYAPNPGHAGTGTVFAQVC